MNTPDVILASASVNALAAKKGNFTDPDRCCSVGKPGRAWIVGKRFSPS
jgi:hypothetical protein